MSNPNHKLPPDLEAFGALSEVVKETHRVGELFRRAQMDAPPTLKAMLRAIGEQTSSTTPHQATIQPHKPERPIEAKDDWLWVPAEEASVRTVVLAVLREGGRPLPAREIAPKVKALLKEVSEGTIANLGAQLEAKKIITRGKDGWRVDPLADAPVIFKGHVWSPAAMMQKYDLAAFRRNAILHLLRTRRDGLQVMQIFKELEAADWLKDVPLNHFLIKEDIEVLAKTGKIRQIGNTGKWTIKENAAQ